MASRFFKPSRIVAVLLVAGAAAWILSGQVAQKTNDTANAAEAGGTIAPAAPPAAVPVQKVAVAMATPEKHERQITLSCVTQADQRSSAVARGAGIIAELKV